MATSTQVLDVTPTTDWFADPLAALRSLFSAQLPDGTETPGTASRMLPPPTDEWRDWAPPTAGETVDTSQADPERTTVASTGTPD
ncbi:hypothetical protein ABT324_03180 [Saccharopolyspora sp. NPDC000359]|uniref:hypothetical protein n=1 Tax=Saccharopolyspora sp. NPDC000359 TaxID=3154251 RepID=UPI003327E14B